MKISDAYTAAAYKAYTAVGGTGGKTFSETLEDAKNKDRLEISGAGKANTSDMTMDEYKAYIYNKLSSMKVDPSRKNDWISVNISEDGFAAMKNDPKYEKWVLDTVRNDLLCRNPYSKYGGIFDIKYFGASKDEYRCDCWNMGSDRAREIREEKRAKLSFWELRRKRQKMYAELAEQHRIREKETEEAVIAEKLFEEKNIYCKKAPRFTFSAARDFISD